MNMKRIIIMIICLLVIGLGYGQVPTRDEFLGVCDSLGIHHAEVVWAQARLESGNFKAKSYQSSKNCLGIYDSKRKCYRKFGSWRECLKSYRDGVQYRCPHPEYTDEEYMAWLKRIGYATEPTYIDRVRKILKSGN